MISIPTARLLARERRVRSEYSNTWLRRFAAAVIALLAIAPWLTANEPPAAPVETSAVAAACENCAENGDELWLISTRHLGAPHTGQSIGSQLHVQVWRDGRFQSSDMNEFNRGDRPDRLTAVYVPGNRSTTTTAIQHGWRINNALQGSRPEGGSLRMVIWNWPSDRVFGMVRDVRTKAERTNVDAFYFAAFLRRMRSDQPVCLIGYSYGSRIAMGGVHLHQGGRLGGRELSPPTSAGYLPNECVGVQCQLVLLAAAFDSNGIDSNGRYNMAPQGVSDMMLMVNHRDPVLSKYHLLSGVSAAGFSGLSRNSSQPAIRLVVRDVTSMIQRSHDENRYYNSGYVINNLNWFAWGVP